MKENAIRWAILAVVVISTCLTAGCGSPQCPDGEYTILLYQHTDPELHSRHAAEHLPKAEKFTGWQGLFVVTDDRYSGLYWGRYRTREDAAANLKTARGYRTPADVQLFRRAIIVRLPGKDVGEPKYSLKNTTDGYYSVLIAVFYDVSGQFPGRKKRAAEYCDRLRKHNYEAYYFHGPNKSGVCIGLFPKEAIVTKKIAMTHPQSRQKSFVEKKIHVDPRMRKLLEVDFPDLQVNEGGEAQKILNPETGRTELKKQRSYAFVIPGRDKPEPHPAPEREATPPVRPGR